MTIEELELDPDLKFIPTGAEASSYEVSAIEPIFVGKWQCSDCKIWIDGGEPQDLCRFCKGHKLIIEEMNNKHIEEHGELPRHIFQRLNDDGQLVYSTISEDGRIVDLRD